MMVMAIAIAPRLCAQTIINLDFKQNPIFEVSTNNVDTALPDDGTPLTLGADLTVAGGSGVYFSAEYAGKRHVANIMTAESSRVSLIVFMWNGADNL